MAQDENLRRITVSNDDGDVYVESSGDGSEIVLKTEKVRIRDGDVYCGTSTVGLSESIDNENKLLEENKYNINHFRCIHIYHLDSLSIDITKHSKVPKHIAIRDKPSIDKILEKCNCRIDQLPIILRTDEMAKRLRLSPGDICEITRVTQSAGDVVYYRVCK